MKSAKKTLLGIVVIMLVSILLLQGFLYVLDFSSGRGYSVQELEEHFNEQKKAITELNTYYTQLVPNNYSVEVEFESNRTLAILSIHALNPATQKFSKTLFQEWNLKINSPKVDSVLKTLGWTQKTLKTIKTKLDKAGCIAITSGEPTRIGFQRSGLGMYFFNVPTKPLSDSLRKYYQNHCSYVISNDQLVFEYRGGAVGSDCFDRKEKAK